MTSSSAKDFMGLPRCLVSLISCSMSEVVLEFIQFYGIGGLLNPAVYDKPDRCTGELIVCSRRMDVSITPIPNEKNKVFPFCKFFSYGALGDAAL